MLDLSIFRSPVRIEKVKCEKVIYRWIKSVIVVVRWLDIVEVAI